MSENATIEVIGVRSSWLTWARKASFWAESAVSFAFASPSLRAVRASSAVAASSRSRSARVRLASPATSIRSATVIGPRPATRAISATAVAAPTVPAIWRSNPDRKRGVSSGSQPDLPCWRAASRNSSSARSLPHSRAASVSSASARAGPPPGVAEPSGAIAWTKDSACIRSAGAGKSTSETPSSKTRFTASASRTEPAKGSTPPGSAGWASIPSDGR